MNLAYYEQIWHYSAICILLNLDTSCIYHIIYTNTIFLNLNMILALRSNMIQIE